MTRPLHCALHTFVELQIYTINYSFWFTALASVKDIPVEQPYVQNVQMDFVYFGYCSIVSLENLRIKMIEKGIIEDDIDSNFYLLLFLKVSLLEW